MTPATAPTHAGRGQRDEGRDGGAGSAGDEDAGGVGAERQQRDPADRELAGEADHQVEAGDQHPVDRGAAAISAEIVVAGQRQQRRPGRTEQRTAPACGELRAAAADRADAATSASASRHHTRRAAGAPNRPCGAASSTTMNTPNTATEANTPPTRKFAACWNNAEREPADDRAAVVAEAAERDRHEAVEVEHRAVGEERQQHAAAGEARQAADRAGQREAGDAQVALRQAERAGGEIILGDGEEGVADQRVAVEELQPADDGQRRRRTGSQNFSRTPL